MRKLALALILCATIALGATPVAADVAADVAKVMEKLRQEKPISINALKTAQPSEVLSALWDYIGDPSETVRIYSLQEALGIARSATDRKLQQEAAELVLTGTEREPLPALAQNIASRMVSLPRSAFSKRSKDIIGRMMLRADMPAHVKAEIVRLAGVANVNTVRVKRELQRLAETPFAFGRGSAAKRNKAPLWALARMGDKAAVQAFVADLSTAAEPAERASAMHKLAYLRQPEAVAALVGVLFSEERMPGLEGRVGSKWAEIALTYLMETVEGFPFDANAKAEERIERARQWVTQQGLANLRIKD